MTTWYAYASHHGGFYYTDEYLNEDDTYCELCGCWDDYIGQADNTEDMIKVMEEEDCCLTEDDKEHIKTLFEEVPDTDIVIQEPKSLTDNHNNAEIILNVLSDKEMYDLGFTKFNKTDWYLNRRVYEGITFNLTIKPDKWEIDVLDEEFLQPYDYQLILRDDPRHKVASHVFYNVEAIMDELKEAGVVNGHVYGHYI